MPDRQDDTMLQNPDTASPVVVWTEIPVTDMERAVAFYDAVFGWQMKIDETGPNPMATFANSTAGVGGHLYPGVPASAAGPTVHIAVPDRLEAAMDRCRNSGGILHGSIIPIPFGRFVYATDPDGNSIGLFEPAA
ncbi:MAG: VOC family protein [Pseudomonadota bacterium]